AVVVGGVGRAGQGLTDRQGRGSPGPGPGGTHDLHEAIALIVRRVAWDTPGLGARFVVALLVLVPPAFLGSDRLEPVAVGKIPLDRAPLQDLLSRALAIAGDPVVVRLEARVLNCNQWTGDACRVGR